MMTWQARWQRLGRRQQLVLMIGGGGIAAWGLWRVAVRPLSQHVRRLQRDVQTTEQQLLEAVMANRQAEEVNKAFASYESYVKPAGDPESELAGFLSEVESAVHQSGVVALNLKPIATHEGSSDRLSVAMEGESTPGQLMQFLDLLQRSTRLLHVTELAVRVTEGRTLRSSMVISKLLLQAH